MAPKCSKQNEKLIIRSVTRCNCYAAKLFWNQFFLSPLVRGDTLSFFNFLFQKICQLPSNAQRVEITSPNTQNMELTNPNLSQFIPIYTNLPQLIQFFQIFNLSKLSFSFFFLETFFLTSKFCDLLIRNFAMWLNLAQFSLSAIFT